MKIDQREGIEACQEGIEAGVGSYRYSADEWGSIRGPSGNGIKINVFLIKYIYNEGEMKGSKEGVRFRQARIQDFQKRGVAIM